MTVTFNEYDQTTKRPPDAPIECQLTRGRREKCCSFLPFRRQYCDQSGACHSGCEKRMRLGEGQSMLTTEEGPRTEEAVQFHLIPGI